MTSNNRHSGNGSRSHLEFHVGGLHVIVRPPLIHLAASPSKTTHRLLGPPQMFDGSGAQHVTIPLEPLTRGRNAGKINVHVTARDGKRHHRIALLGPADVEAAFARFAWLLGEYAMKNRRHFTLEELRSAGFGVVLPGEWIEGMLGPHAGHRTVLRLNHARIERAVEKLEVFDLDILDELRDANQVTLTDGNGQNLIIGWWPEGDGPEHPPGWYGLPIDRSGVDAVVEGFLVSLGTPFFDALETIARELQADIDLDALERLRARASARQISS